MKYVLFACGIAVADYFAKYCAKKKIAPGHSIELHPKFRVYNLRNYGAAMGLFRNNPRTLALLTAFSSLNILGHFYKLHKTGKLDRGFKFSLACIVGGSAGNLCDRIRRGYVTDVVQIGKGPVFNIADVFIILGAAVFMVKQGISRRNQA